MQRTEAALKACTDPQLAKSLKSAACAALAGGTVVKNLYNHPHTIRMKGEIDLVTEADTASETAIIRSLRQDFPEIEFLAEESAGENYRISRSATWIIDPLDGTTNFAHNLPIFCVSIALWDGNSPRVGVIYCPMQEELFCATRNGGAWLNNRKITVTATDSLIKALVATGFPYDIHTHLDAVSNRVRKVLPQVRDIRRMGAAAVDLAYLACGRFDGFWESNLKPWDTAAGMLLVEEAGGSLSTFSGSAYSPFVPEIVASNTKLHSRLLSLLTL